MRYDYIIVGAGSAGCVLANRLTSDRTCNVLLVEAGGSNDSLYVDMPAALSIPMNRKRFNWGFRSEPDEGMAGRRLDCPRGRGLGGSSAINGMVYVRGHADDFNHWGELGADGWSMQDVAPYFERSEAMLQPRTGELKNPLYNLYLEAGRQAGHAVLGDLNHAPQEGVGLLAMTVAEGRRNSAKRAYLDPARQRHNLTIMKRTTVSRVLFDDARATGIEMRTAFGTTRVAHADREVLLCAGAIGSPALLQHSGVGDADLLARLAIPLVAHRPEVGLNLMDHLEVYVQQACVAPISLHRWLNPLGKLAIGVEWLLAKTGLGATNHFETGAFLRSHPSASRPDIQFHFLPAAMHYDGSKVAASHGFQIHTGPMLPRSRGHVRIRSADPAEPPEIRFNYLDNEQDRADFRAAVREARRLFAQPVFDEVRGPELAPGPGVDSDEALDEWIASNAESAYHPCGTCRMGSDPGAVVDVNGRVNGVTHLRVVDASIFPMITNGNLNAPTIMAAEKLAEAVLQAPTTTPT